MNGEGWAWPYGVVLLALVAGLVIVFVQLN
ncbi:hypothetical protein LCGC14_2874530 [marine sediment metagenome]|uniref:Uncharacterized protein n=1 Tax=marine sediment metagenome TaxID=412755 RepID=A0A0F8YNT0_9ZZZZ